MCEREFSAEHGDSPDGFCSEPCRRVHEHLYETDDAMATDEA
jgi:hypothetical protein